MPGDDALVAIYLPIILIFSMSYGIWDYLPCIQVDEIKRW
jgi:hypothetical protein